MKKKLRRLRLERETLRNLTPDHLENVVGGDLQTIFDDTRYNSCDLAVTRPRLICCSLLPLIC